MITALCDKIGELIQTEAVQNCCNYKPESGMKYCYFGGQPQKTDGFKRLSKVGGRGFRW